MKRPYVFVNMAMTADGKITSSQRDYPGFTSPEDRVRMDHLRARADALMVAAGTVRADNPAWHVRTESERTGKGLDRVLISSSADIPEESRFFDTEFGGKSILVTVDGTDIQRFEGRCEVWRIGNERVDLSATLQRLATAGVGRLLVEGGGEFNWQLLRDDLVDEINLTLAPALLGGRDAPTWLEGSGWTMKQQRRLRLQSIERLGDELYLRYLVDRENDGA